MVQKMAWTTMCSTESIAEGVKVTGRWMHKLFRDETQGALRVRENIAEFKQLDKILQELSLLMGIEGRDVYLVGENVTNRGYE